MNYNNNEFNILDYKGMNSRLRYPLAKTSESEFQQMDYKDWMNFCTSGESGDQFGIDSEAVRDGLVITTGLLWAILSIPFPYASAAAGIANVLIPYLWPSDKPVGSSQAQISWEKMMQAAEELIDEKMLEHIKAEALLQLETVQSSLRDYQQAICNWKTDPNNPLYQADAKREFQDVDDELKKAMIRFNRPGYEITLLTSYVQGANLHLTLLRDVVLYGESWGFSSLEVQQYYSNTMIAGNPGMLQLSAKYTDHCVRWYNEGLNQLYQKLAPGYSVDSWNEYNNFRRDMTLMVLDIISLWPTYDPKLYAYPTTSQITRKIYTSMLGKRATTLSDFEKAVIAPPSLFTRLREATFFTRTKTSGEPSDYIEFTQYCGYKLKLQKTLDEDLLEAPLVGTECDITSYVSIGTGANLDVYKISTISQAPGSLRDFEAPQTLEFYFSPSESSKKVGIDYAGIAGKPTATVNQGAPCKDSVSDDCDPCTSTVPCTLDNYDNSIPCNNASLYSHQLAWIGATVDGNPQRLNNFTYGWTHISANVNNLLDGEKITQIPAVKAYNLSNGSRVIKGPGSTGGDLVEISPTYGILSLNITSPAGRQKYLVRIRYASNIKMNLDMFMTGVRGQFTAPATTTDMTNLTYNKFGYLDTVVYDYNLSEGFVNVLRIYSTSSESGSCVIDKIEFIPIKKSLTEYEANQKLENARMAVDALFINNAKNILRLDITDYDVDQAANKVDCMSDDMFQKEKMILRDQVKLAKRLSQARNLLNYGDFESPNWSNKNGWKASNSVTVQADHPISRGRYLHMPGARSIEFSDKLYSTYAYQKVDESKLKPYTRYLVRGFIGNSRDLELFVTRYGKEVHDKMNISLNRVNTYSQRVRVPYSCGMGEELEYTMSTDPCQTNTYAANTFDMMMSPTKGVCEDKQHFVFHIDVGEIDQRENLGIGVGFKISSVSGMAQLDNLEVIEANSLTGEALARVKKREQKWKREMEQKCMLTEKVVSVAKQAVDDLFTNAQKNRLKATTTMQNILHAEAKVENIPYVYDPYFEDIPDMNFAIFQALQSDVLTAAILYKSRNVIQNGDFSIGLSHWHATAGANVQERDGNPHVLVISNWDANVSQKVCVQPERGYILRVTARKEGSGNGYVTISDCTEANKEIITYTSNEPVGTPRTIAPARRTIEPDVCNKTRYNESFGTVPNTSIMNYTAENTNREVCSCGCNNTIHTPSTNYQSKTYPSKPSMTDSLTSYITKTIEMFPETNRVQIEIGETEGTFLVESIELICMED